MIEMLNTCQEEPYDGRLSRTVLWEAWGEIPLAYSACAQKIKQDTQHNVLQIV